MSLAEECLWNLDCIKARIIKEVRELPRSRGTLLRHINELPNGLLEEAGRELEERDVELLLNIELSDKVIALISGVDPGKVSSINLLIRLAEALMEGGRFSEAMRLLRGRMNGAVGEDSLRLRALMELCQGFINLESSSVEHSRGNHDAEFRLINEAMSHFSEAYRHYEDLGELTNALEVRLTGLIELAKYYLTHGDLDNARSTYLQCASTARWSKDHLTEATRCSAMARLIDAIEDSDPVYYEEAGDMLLNVAQEEPEAAEEAKAAYGSALQLINDDEGKGRVFMKYLTAAIIHIDWLISQKYGGFEGLINTIRNLGLRGVASELGIDEKQIRLYLEAKALAKVGGFNGVKIALALTLMGLTLSSSTEELMRRLREAGVEVSEGILNEAKNVLGNWLI
ncbi:hypothetical protein [Caldivirga sp. UBA161]|uniref:hypothetical protein n=1 Tax=Caldivirga sp. UBA161 TaxID=1915569 RepID=UPI0025B8663D|nr:hypothetical protein [Caldivirga sp. UBA161]